MPIFKISNDILSQIQESPIKLEKDLQKLTEKNLKTIFGLEFVSTEFSLNDLRIDTVAFDSETGAFVIIEYKRDKSFSIIDQGYAYLALMLNNKAEFILEYNERMKVNLKREDVDWSQSKIVFIANSFTTYQKNAINFKDLPIELWEVKKYDNGTILYTHLKPLEAKESIKTVSRSKTVEKVSSEVKKYSVEDHFGEDWEESREMFAILKTKILELDGRIEEKVNRFYIGYKIGSANLCCVNIRKSKITLSIIRLEKKDLKDPEKKVQDTPWEKWKIGRHCNYVIESLEDIEYGMFLVRQAYEKFYK